MRPYLGQRILEIILLNVRPTHHLELYILTIFLAEFSQNGETSFECETLPETVNFGDNASSKYETNAPSRSLETNNFSSGIFPKSSIRHFCSKVVKAIGLGISKVIEAIKIVLESQRSVQMKVDSLVEEIKIVVECQKTVHTRVDSLAHSIQHQPNMVQIRNMCKELQLAVNNQTQADSFADFNQRHPYIVQIQDICAKLQVAVDNQTKVDSLADSNQRQLYMVQIHKELQVAVYNQTNVDSHQHQPNLAQIRDELQLAVDNHRLALYQQIQAASQLCYVCIIVFLYFHTPFLHLFFGLDI